MGGTAEPDCAFSGAMSVLLRGRHANGVPPRADEQVVRTQRLSEAQDMVGGTRTRRFDAAALHGPGGR